MSMSLNNDDNDMQEVEDLLLKGKSLVNSIDTKLPLI